MRALLAFKVTKESHQLSAYAADQDISGSSPRRFSVSGNWRFTSLSTRITSEIGHDISFILVYSRIKVAFQYDVYNGFIEESR
jgi:hypothetical protein